ncbi:hypothetical protein TELCIR_07090, partial [Teladorsagia circumcincta]
LVVGVCFERVIGVRSPLHRLVAPSKRRLVAGLLLLLSACAALTCYYHVSQQCFMKVFCHGTQWIAKCVDVTSNGWQANSTNPSSQLLRQYVTWMRAANVALVVVIPLVFLVVLNSMLMYYVKKRSFFLHASLTKLTRRMQREGQAKLPFVGTLFRRHSDQVPNYDDKSHKTNLSVEKLAQNRPLFVMYGCQLFFVTYYDEKNDEDAKFWPKSAASEPGIELDLMQQKMEHRVAVTVCAVVTSFTITQV